MVKALLCSGRDIEMDRKTKSGTTAAEIAKSRHVEVNPKYEDAILERRDEDGVEIANLITSFVEDPNIARQRLFDTDCDLREQALADTFALVVFLADGYLTIKQGVTLSSCTGSSSNESRTAKEINEEKAVRFLKIASSVPLDLQMILSNVVFGSFHEFVLSRLSEPAFKRIAKKTILAEERNTKP